MIHCGHQVHELTFQIIGSQNIHDDTRIMAGGYVLHFIGGADDLRTKEAWRRFQRLSGNNQSFKRNGGLESKEDFVKKLLNLWRIGLNLKSVFSKPNVWINKKTVVFQKSIGIKIKEC